MDFPLWWKDVLFCFVFCFFENPKKILNVEVYKTSISDQNIKKLSKLCSFFHVLVSVSVEFLCIFNLFFYCILAICSIKYFKKNKTEAGAGPQAYMTIFGTYTINTYVWASWSFDCHGCNSHHLCLSCTLPILLQLAVTSKTLLHLCLWK